ncbi:hypothetical protein FGG78_33555, partial [Thioclava sp. BHET1]
MDEDSVIPTSSEENVQIAETHLRSARLPKQDNSALIRAARIRRERLAAERSSLSGSPEADSSDIAASPTTTESDSVRRDREALRAQQQRAEEHRLGANERRRERQRELEERRKQERDHNPQLKEQAKSAQSPHLQQGWIPKGQPFALAGRDIGGMIYLGTPPRLISYGSRDGSRPYIDPSLPVATSGTDREGNGMPYWPGYSDISPVCRATYLDWLADGRRDTSYDAGYMFLYFYGLERRFMIDQGPEEERQDILAEVRRLASIYASNPSVQRYLGEFLQIAQVAVQDAAANEPLFEHNGWELPFGLKVAIGAKVAQDEPLGWDWILSWLICHPEYYLRTPATRCAEEFRALFRLRFEKRYPAGLK